jgi:hypothetical protein
MPAFQNNGNRSDYLIKIAEAARLCPSIVNMQLLRISLAYNPISLPPFIP